jgi:hypothetical protein
MAKFRHLHIRGLGTQPNKFRAKSGGQTKYPPAVENRASHAQRLRNGLEVVSNDLKSVLEFQAENGVPTKKRGIAITFEGRPNLDLVTGNRRATSPGLKLYTVQKRNYRAQAPSDRATYFVNSKTVDTLLENLEEYERYQSSGLASGINSTDNDDDTAEDRPRNFWLFESSSAIRPSRLSDFWTDEQQGLPKAGTRTYWQVWLRKDLEEEFLEAAKELELRVQTFSTEFVEAKVRIVHGLSAEMEELIRRCPGIVELKSASSLSADYLRDTPIRRADNASAIAARIQPPPQGAPRIALLDTGVNSNNPLLRSSLATSRCFAVGNSWPVSDHSDHGTRMAGVAQFFDLEYHLTTKGPIQLWTSLESVVVSAPSGFPRISGMTAIQRAVALLEAEPADRVFCLAQTARGEVATGKPTSTSATIDLLAYGDGSKPRLFCVAAGNVPTSASNEYDVRDYTLRNYAHALEAPAQAANAITVGAMTLKASKPGLVAPAGDMAPTSRSSASWNFSHTTKPDIVMEGGNFITNDDGNHARPSSDDLVLTTSGAAPSQPFALTGETSAATARASGLLARMKAYYPKLRPESLRGLLVHSARWTPAMLNEQQRLLGTGKSQTEAWAEILARYGWGTPDESVAYLSSEEEVCVIIEDEITPFERGQCSTRIKEMKYFKLPWPKNALRSLSNTQVELRCTLSYFIEPDPQAVSRGRPDRYQSFGLSFDVKRHTETDLNAQARYNDAMLYQSTGRGDDGWTVGDKLSDRGTLHQDIWIGPAYELADRDGISVIPKKGWWADITSAGRIGNSVKFSLILSLKAPAGNNLFAEVAANAAHVLVDQPVLVTV